MPYGICGLRISVSLFFWFGMLQHQRHARADREMKGEPMATSLAQPKIDYCAFRFFLTDRGRNIFARLFGVPDFIGEEPPLLGMQKLCIAFGIGALCDHGLFRLEMLPISLMLQNASEGNELSVPMIRREIPVCEAGMLADLRQNAFAKSIFAASRSLLLPGDCGSAAFDSCDADDFAESAC